MLLMEIRGKCISYSAHKKKVEGQREAALIEEITELEKHIDERNMQTLQEKKDSLQALRKKKVDGMIVRSRAKWIHEGEKNSKYFCGLEKRNFVEKAMFYLETEEGNILTEQESIKKEVKSYYETLYDSREGDIADVDLSTVVHGPSLSAEDSNSIEGPITKTEALMALKKMQNNKSPGSDGFTAEFYKFFWSDLGSFLVRCINESFDKGQMSITQRQGIITCIPKEGKKKKS
eukprot:TRINITY_DN12531_c0_g1_i2.p1 TRINITY_DN12531_c0_g1~~TRINITY_DN12531_c0_g1_i2.p1  ORF type:complete len:233 (-),score=32.72 TRINITY_DN12531_c0_g1_i2:446-1144(-)